MDGADYTDALPSAYTLHSASRRIPLHNIICEHLCPCALFNFNIIGLVHVLLTNKNGSSWELTPLYFPRKILRSNIIRLIQDWELQFHVQGADNSCTG